MTSPQTDTLSFSVSFHGPFHAFTGSAGAHLDAVADLDDPLPGSALKGAMKRSAAFLGVPDAVILDVFGSPRSPSPWAWDTDPQTALLALETRARVPIDPESGSARSGAIRFAEELWSTDGTTMTLLITRKAWIDPQARDRHTLVLRSAARALTSIGADRNRGFGWVSVAEKPSRGGLGDVDLPDLVQAIMALRLDRPGTQP